MPKFAEELQNTPANKPKNRLSLLDDFLLVTKTDKILKDYISDEMCKNAELIICSFKDACLKNAKNGKRDINWSSGNIVYITHGSFLDGLFNFDKYPRQKAEKIKMLIEKELSEMGFQSYSISFAKKADGYNTSGIHDYYFYFKIRARW